MRSTLLALPLLSLLLLGCGEQDASPPLPAQRTPLLLTADTPDASPTAQPAVEAQFKPFEELAHDVRAARRVAVIPEQVPPPAVPQTSQAQEVEPNNDADSAQVVTAPFVVKARMDPVDKSLKEGDSDWFTFDVSIKTPGLLDLDVSALAGADLGLEVYREGLRGREILISVNNMGPGKPERIPNVCLVNGKYWVRVFQKPPKKKKAPFSSKEAVYELTAAFEEAQAGQECEPNGEPLVARLVELPAAIHGHLNRIDDEDLYVLDLSRLSPLSFFRVELLPPMGSKLVFAVLNRARQEVFSLESSGGQKILVPNLGLLAGFSEYFLSVRGAEKNAALGPYQLSVTVDRLKERMELEPNAAAELALRLPYDQPLQGWIVADRDVDLFRIEAPSDMPAEGQPMPLGRPVIQLVLSGVPGVDLAIELLSDDGADVLQVINCGGKGEPETIPNTPVPKSPLLLRVKSTGGSNSNEPYIVQMTLVPTDGAEQEPNETPDAANLLNLGEEVRGFLPHVQDQDCFAISAGREGLVLRAPDDAGLRVARVLATGETQVAELAKGKSATLPKEAAAYTLCVALREGAERGTAKPYTVGGTSQTP